MHELRLDVEDLDSELDSAALVRAAGRHGLEHERIDAVVHGRCAGAGSGAAAPVAAPRALARPPGVCRMPCAGL
ncbi:MAG TPA: hypothetical protein VG474_17105 [Solirubrobacteraceae bacterium]|nr:hypothetical protein [Solirubrobacteraceae bacterium]